MKRSEQSELLSQALRFKGRGQDLLMSQSSPPPPPDLRGGTLNLPRGKWGTGPLPNLGRARLHADRISWHLVVPPQNPLRICVSESPRRVYIQTSAFVVSSGEVPSRSVRVCQ